MWEHAHQDDQVARLRLDDLPAELLARVVGRLRKVKPVAIGVLVTGSYADGGPPDRATST